MTYKVPPLLYAANEYFKNTVRFVFELNDAVDIESLEYAAGQVQKRYPYFSVRIEQQGEELVLQENSLPFVIVSGDKPLCLSSEESNYHLVSFCFKDNIIYLDFTHMIADGNGIAPVAKTLMYYYIEHKYGADGIDKADIRLVDNPIDEGEYIYPFPEAPLPAEDSLSLKQKEYDALVIEDSLRLSVVLWRTIRWQGCSMWGYLQKTRTTI